MRQPEAKGKHRRVEVAVWRSSTLQLQRNLDGHLAVAATTSGLAADGSIEAAPESSAIWRAFTGPIPFTSDG